MHVTVRCYYTTLLDACDKKSKESRNFCFSLKHTNMSALFLFNRFPNELFYEIFEYLTSYDILYAFSGLNQRIDSLLQNYSKYRFNFQSCTKSQFDFVCKSITCEQIQSLILADSDDTCQQIRTFFQLFYIRKCINIESLNLIEITEQNLSKLLPKIKFLPKLTCLSIDLKNSLIPNIECGSSLKSLSVTTCSMSRLCELLLSVPLLTKLNVELITDDTNRIVNSSLTTNIHQLKIKLRPKSNVTFNEIGLLFQWMPKLKQLTFIAIRGMRFVHGNQWESLIRMYLSDLKQFHFAIHPNLQHHYISQNLSTFQTPFWLEEKQWIIHCNYYSYVDYHLGNLCRTNFYTLPYCDEQFELFFSTKTLTTPCKSQYATVKNLYFSIDDGARKNINDNYYFSNLNSLTIRNLYKPLSIDTFIDLSTIKHLTIEQGNPINPKECFSYLLMYMTNLQSLQLTWHCLVEITHHFKNQEVCSILSKQIKFLSLIDIISEKEDNGETRQALEKLSQIFSSNLIKVSISVMSFDNIVFIFEQMFQLSSLKFEYNARSNIDSIQLWLKRNIPRLKNFTYEVRSINEKRTCWLLWIGR